MVFSHSTGIFLGNDSNPSAYCIYDSTNNKVILSCSVILYENIPGNCPSPSSSPEFKNFTPYYEIEGDDNQYNNEIKYFNDFSNNNTNK